MSMTTPEDRTASALQSQLADQSGTPGAQHTRTYQACIPCRRRKVRCDLGPVDNPHDPPCVRCRREAKECYFSATRRKKRAADSGSGANDADLDDYEIRGGRKRLKEDSLEQEAEAPPPAFTSYDAVAVAVAAAPSHSPVYLAQPLTPGGSVGRRQPLRRPTAPSSAFGDFVTEEQVNNQTTAIMQKAELHNGHDALNVLLAAAQSHPDSMMETKPPIKLDPRATSTASPTTTQHPSPEQHAKPSHKPSQLGIDPMIMLPLDESEHAAALHAWSRFRFVRNGWFSPKEGIAYIEYFYTYLSPLTPIALPDYRHPSKHIALLENEPMLAVTILMIASRYTFLENRLSVGRSYALHQRLWTYTQRLIDRLVWGREPPGVSASANQGDAGCDVNPLRRKGLLTLGTVESLMLLTEWHSRHVHFPADEDDAQLMAPEEMHASSEGGDLPTDIGGKTTTSWLEPCYRSDRMCWKLLNMALSVALEIGVFDGDSSRHTKAMSKDWANIYDQRRLHVKSLLLVYITQTSGRLGITAMLPRDHAVPELSELYAPKHGIIRDRRDMVIHFWLQLSRLVKMGNEKLYANRQYTRDIIRTGKYKTLLQEINPLLTKWRHGLENLHGVPEQMKHIMMIEYEHSRVCVNQLALQAVVERCLEANTSEGGSAKAIPPDRLNQWYGDDRENVGTVIEACRNVLNIVVDGLAPRGFLKHAPVRTSFRIISVAMVLVKTFAFGANAKEMNISLSLMDRTVTALRENVVDDVHIANGFAQFVKILTERIPKALKRFPGSGNGTGRGLSTSRGVSQSPAPQSMYTATSQLGAHAQSHLREGVSHDQQIWPFNGLANSENHMQDSNGQEALPLDGYEFSDNSDFMIMPPPANHQGLAQQSMQGAAATADYTQYNDGSGAGGGGYGGNHGFALNAYPDPSWMGLPLNNILGGQNVAQTGFGPVIDGNDMLDMLLN